MTSQVERLKQEAFQIFKSVNVDCKRINGMTENSPVWFNLGPYEVENWCVKVSTYPPVRNRSDPRAANADVNKLLNILSQLIDVGQEHFDAGRSSSDLHWDEINSHKWLTDVKKVYTLQLPSSIDFKDDKVLSEITQTTVDKIISQIDDLWRDDCLIIHGFPLMFELNMYILLLIGKLFKKVGLVCPHGQFNTVILYKFDCWNLNIKKLLNDVILEMEVASPKDLFITNCSDFFESNFFKVMVNFNFYLIKEQISNILDDIKTSGKRNDTHNVVPVSSKESSTQHFDSSCKELTFFSPEDELELLSVYLHQTDIVMNANDGVIWFEFPSQRCPILALLKKTRKYECFEEVEVSKFCVRPLLQCHRKLSKIFKENFGMNFQAICDRQISVSSETKKFIWSDSLSHTVQLDFGMKSWLLLEDHSKQEMIMLQNILSVLREIEEKECLELRGFPMLSEFSVSLVFLLSHLFEKVGFMVPDKCEDTVLQFCHYRQLSSSCISIKLHLEQALQEIDILSLVPLSTIFCGDYYERVREMNNMCLKLQSHHLLLCVKQMEGE